MGTIFKEKFRGKGFFSTIFEGIKLINITPLISFKFDKIGKNESSTRNLYYISCLNSFRSFDLLPKLLNFFFKFCQFLKIPIFTLNRGWNGPKWIAASHYKHTFRTENRVCLLSRASPSTKSFLEYRDSNIAKCEISDWVFRK